MLKNIPYELEKYVNPNPTETIGGVSIVSGQTLPNDDGIGRVMRITAGSGFGFVDLDTSKPWMMRVSDKLDYEIGFWFKQSIFDPTFELSINAFSCQYVAKKTFNVTDGSEEASFLLASERTVGQVDKWMYARYILFNKDKSLEPNVQPTTSLSVGRNLIMEEGVTNIIVNLLCRNGQLDMYDFKIKPLKNPFETCFIQGSDILTIRRKNNNSTESEKDTDNKANRFLLPYNTNNTTIKL